MPAQGLRERAAADVDALRRKTHEQKHKAALDKRQKILESMGMGIARGSAAGEGGSGGKVVVSQTATPGVMEDLEEETGHVCVVCGEGELYRPGEALGCYTFCRRVTAHAAGGGAAPVSTSGRGESYYTSVSHFNVIHFSCHRERTSRCG